MTNEMNQENNLSPEEISRRKFLNRLTIGLAIFGAAVVSTPLFAFILEPLYRKREKVWRTVGKIDDFVIGDTVRVTFMDSEPEPWAGKIAWTAAWLGNSSSAVDDVAITGVGDAEEMAKVFVAHFRQV